MILRNLCTRLACGVAIASPSFAWDTVYANSVPNVTNWNNESAAAGNPPNSNCDMSSPDYAYADGGTTWLVGNFPNVTIPPNSAVSLVLLEVMCRYDQNEAAVCRISGTWSGNSTGNDYTLNSGSGNCAWRQLDLTNSEAVWSQAEINSIQGRIRRQSGTNPNNRLRAKAFKLTVLFAPDCNGNGIPDYLDPDCDDDGSPDDCDGPDCNGNGRSDNCDIALGSSSDCNGNGIPDECDPDCDGDGVPDACDGPDCNGNGRSDNCDIALGSSSDCNGNGVPDECDPDCDGDGSPDACDGPDCNNNGRPDNCDIALGSSDDCNGNGVPDECEFTDCNGNGQLDVCDISQGVSDDCNANGVPDECEPGDCDADGVPDACETDCNGNGVPDDCDLLSGTSQDTNGNNVPDECEQDCNGNGVTDLVDISSGTSFDCNGNSIPDECDLASHTSEDCNANGVPDECDITSGASADGNGDGVPDECPQVERFCDCVGGSTCLQSDLTAGCPNSTGFGGFIDWGGSTSVLASDFSVGISSLPNGVSGILFMGTNETLLVFGDGLRCVGGSIFRFNVRNSGPFGSMIYSDVIGYANTTFPSLGNIQPGDLWHFQGWYRDPSGPCGSGYNVSNALRATFAP